MTSGKGLRQDELKGPESTSKPTLPWLWLLSLPGTVCPVPIIPVISPPFLSHPTPFFLLLLLFPLPCSPWPSPTLTWMDRGLGGMERGWEEETQCREVGGSDRNSFSRFPEKGMESQPHGTWGPGNTELEESGDGMKCYPKDVLKPSPQHL